MLLRENEGTPKASDLSSLPKQTCSREPHLIGTHLCLPGGGVGAPVSNDPQMLPPQVLGPTDSERLGPATPGQAFGA